MFYCYCIDACIDVRLSHLNKDYLLTYLLTYMAEIVSSNYKLLITEDNNNLLGYIRTVSDVQLRLVGGGLAH